MLTVIYVPRKVRLLGVGGASDVFTEANSLIYDRPLYNLRLVSEQPTPIRCLSGFSIVPTRTIHDEDEPIDTLIIAGSPDLVTMQPNPALVSWVQRHCIAVRRYGSLGEGAFILGAAGLLDGKRVTTHWDTASTLAVSFPSASVEPDAIFVRDGPLFTCAGAAASIDLALSLVEEDHGRALALGAARRVVVYLKRPGSQPQLSVHLAGQIADTSRPIRQAQDWIRDNPQADLSITNLANRAGMSKRTFARTFHRESGMTPASFVEAVRIETAQRLLEETNLPLQRVAANCGFMSMATFRRAFRRRLQRGLLEYRSQLGSGTREDG